MSIGSSNYLTLLINRMARMEGYIMAPSNVQAPVHRENCGAPSENVALILPHFARALAASQHSALPFSTQLPHAGPRGGARSGSVLVSNPHSVGFLVHVGECSMLTQQSAWRTWDTFFGTWWTASGISGIQGELAWASGGRCEFSSSFWTGRAYR